MEAGESLGVDATRQPVNVELDHAVAVRTGPPEAARGPSRVNAAPGVDQERRLVHGFPQPRAQSGLPMLVEGRKLEDMMSKPPNILVQFPKSSPKMPVWWPVDFRSSNGRWKLSTTRVVNQRR